MNETNPETNEAIIRGIAEPAKKALSELFTETMDELRSEARQARILACSFLGSSAIYGFSAIYSLAENNDAAAGGLGIAGCISGGTAIYYAIMSETATNNADAIESVQEILNLEPVEDSNS